VFDGSIRPQSLARVLRALRVKGNELVDLGQDQKGSFSLRLQKELPDRLDTSCRKTRE